MWTDQLTERQARDWAVRDYRTHLTVAKHARSPSTTPSPRSTTSTPVVVSGWRPSTGLTCHAAPKSLDQRAALAARDPSAPRTAGPGAGATAVRPQRRPRVHGKGDKVREIPVHPQLCTGLQLWLADRPDWPGAVTLLLVDR
ncbi:MAG: hypothetical protein ACRDTT_34990 [Pseudonocardiaceae bacterium]